MSSHFLKLDQNAGGEGLIQDQVIKMESRFTTQGHDKNNYPFFLHIIYKLNIDGFVQLSQGYKHPMYRICAR